jgi:uncharacterized protein YbjQ (UPF0145 family)
MAKCDLCGKKMGMFEGSPLMNLKGDYHVCGNCSNAIRSLQEGDIDVYFEMQPIIESVANEDIKSYVKSVTKIDKAELEKQLKERSIKQKTEQFDTLISQNPDFITLTTGYSFEGYDITKYVNIISGECVLGTGFLSETLAGLSDLFGMRSTVFSEKLTEAKDYALHQLKLACYLQGGNAIVGIDFDYITFSNNMIGVIASGTAVIIKHI